MAIFLGVRVYSPPLPPPTFFITVVEVVRAGRKGMGEAARSLMERIVGGKRQLCALSNRRPPITQLLRPSHPHANKRQNKPAPKPAQCLHSSHSKLIAETGNLRQRQRDRRNGGGNALIVAFDGARVIDYSQKASTRRTRWIRVGIQPVPSSTHTRARDVRSAPRQFMPLDIRNYTVLLREGQCTSGRVKATAIRAVWRIDGSRLAHSHLNTARRPRSPQRGRGAVVWFVKSAFKPMEGENPNQHKRKIYKIDGLSRARVLPSFYVGSCTRCTAFNTAGNYHNGQKPTVTVTVAYRSRTGRLAVGTFGTSAGVTTF
ncbi:hypothetical protein DFH09DRAFT_1111367 [Mycena vulgaris]|nr:hypothetical protein DFH09DRAFT_1111367 [Mycena vulgaris]